MSIADIISKSNITIGMFGGKFVPFHKGHLYCLERASKECDLVHLIMFSNRRFSNGISGVWGLRERTEAVERAAAMFDNVIPHSIDTRDCNGWDDETPLVRAIAPRIDRVYSSEPSYGEYFARAYPEAEHILVDPERKEVPISGTMIREMMRKEESEWKKWII